MYSQPLCGWEWYQKHRLDYSQAYIDSLTIVVSVDNRQLPTVSNKDRGIVKDLVKSYRKEAR